jgi:hypothetical protein
MSTSSCKRSSVSPSAAQEGTRESWVGAKRLGSARMPAQKHEASLNTYAGSTIGHRLTQTAPSRNHLGQTDAWRRRHWRSPGSRRPARVLLAHRPMPGKRHRVARGLYLQASRGRASNGWPLIDPAAFQNACTRIFGRCTLPWLVFRFNPYVQANSK